MTPQQQLNAFLAKFTPEQAKVAKSALRTLRKLVPGAKELVYDNWNGLVIGFGPTDRASDAVISIQFSPKHFTLFFLHGATLADPEKLLAGSGRRVRHIKMKDPAELERPEIDDLIERALAQAPKAITGPRKLLIKSVAAKQRPRRPRN